MRIHTTMVVRSSGFLVLGVSAGGCARAWWKVVLLDIVVSMMPQPTIFCMSQGELLLE